MDNKILKIIEYEKDEIYELKLEKDNISYDNLKKGLKNIEININDYLLTNNFSVIDKNTDLNMIDNIILLKKEEIEEKKEVVEKENELLEKYFKLFEKYPDLVPFIYILIYNYDYDDVIEYINDYFNSYKSLINIIKNNQKEIIDIIKNYPTILVMYYERIIKFRNQTISHLNNIISETRLNISNNQEINNESNNGEIVLEESINNESNSEEIILMESSNNENNSGEIVLEESSNNENNSGEIVLEESSNNENNSEESSNNENNSEESSNNERNIDNSVINMSFINNLLNVNNVLSNNNNIINELKEIFEDIDDEVLYDLIETFNSHILII